MMAQICTLFRAKCFPGRSQDSYQHRFGYIRRNNEQSKTDQRFHSNDLSELKNNTAKNNN